MDMALVNKTDDTAVAHPDDYTTCTHTGLHMKEVRPSH